MSCFLDELVVLNATHEPVTQLVAEAEALLAFLVGELGVAAAASLSVLDHGESAYAAEYAALKEYTDSAAIYDPNLAPHPLAAPMVTLHYTGQIPYTKPDEYVFGSAGLYTANLRFQHRRAVWHEALHALGVGRNCEEWCVMAWDVPTTEHLCNVCRMELEASLLNRAEYSNQLRAAGCCDYESMVRRQHEEGEEFLAEVLGLDDGSR